MALPKQRRLKESKIISQVFSKARPTQEFGISVRAMDSRQQLSRFVVVVPMKSAPLAVHRNAIRRRVAETLQRIVTAGGIAPRKNVVVTVRSLLPNATTLEKSLVLLLRKSGILQQ